MEELPFTLEFNNREVRVRDQAGEFCYVDDYYWTGTRTLLRKVSHAYHLVDQRKRFSLEKVFGDGCHEVVQEKFLNGSYGASKQCRFWGGDFAGWRELSIPVEVRCVVDYVRKRKSGRFDWRDCAKRGKWDEVVRTVLQYRVSNGSVDSIKTEMTKKDFMLGKKWLKDRGYLDESKSLDSIVEGVVRCLGEWYCGYSDLEKMSFIVKGAGNVFRYQGDRWCVLEDNMRSLYNKEDWREVLSRIKV